MDSVCKCDPCECDPCECKDVKVCPCPVECRDKMKKMYRYLKDTQVFLKGCDKCPLAQNMLKSCDELLEEFTCKRVL